MEKLPLGKALTLRITRSPVGALVLAVTDPTTHIRLFTGSATDLAKLYPSSKTQETITATKSSLFDKLTGKKPEADAEADPEPEAASQA